MGSRVHELCNYGRSGNAGTKRPRPGLLKRLEHDSTFAGGQGMGKGWEEEARRRLTSLVGEPEASSAMQAQ